MWRASQKLSVIQNVRPRQMLGPGCRRVSTKPALRSADKPPDNSFYPPPPPRSGDMGILKKFLTLVGLGVGGSLAYTWYEPEFRTKVEMNVLFAREVLHFLDKYVPSRSQVLGNKELPQIPWLNGPQSSEEKKKAPVETQAPSKLVTAKPLESIAIPVAVTPEKAAEDKVAAAMEKEKQRL